MNLPTQDQVNAASRHIASAVGGAVVMFGLSSKIDINTVNTIINSLGSIVNNVVIILGIVTPAIAAYYAQKSAKPESQAASLEAKGAIVVGPPELAAATPNSPNVLSQTEVKVVPK